MSRILLIATSGIGDTIALRDLVLTLRRDLPSSGIDLVTTHPEAAFVFEGGVDRVIPLDPGWLVTPGRFLAAFAPAAARIAAAGPYGAAAVTFPSGHRATAALAVASGAPVRVGYAYPEGGASRTGWGLTGLATEGPEGIVERNRALAAAVLGRPLSPFFGAPLTLERKGAFPDLPPVFVALHPGGSAAEVFKRWPEASFAEVGRRLVESGWPVVLAGGTGEEALGRRLAAAIGKDVTDLTGRLDLAGTARVLARAKSLVANDSGLAHLAAAVGTPVVALFGPTSDARYAPVGVLPARVVTAPVPCRPCYVAPRREPFSCRFEREKACLDEIPAERVFSSARELAGLGMFLEDLRARPIERIETERLILRRWRETDREALARIHGDPEVTRFLPGVSTRAESDAFMDRAEARFGQGSTSFLAVESKEDGALLGGVGLALVRFAAPFAPAVEVGWRLARSAWGRGFATEAAKAVLREAFARPGLAEVVSFTVPGNMRSRKVMERLGMSRDSAGDFDHPFFCPGHPLRRHVLYRLKRSPA